MKQKRWKVLVVDDMPGVRSLLTKVFGDQGWQCIEADNGQQALTLAEREQPDVVVLDKRMPPGLDGMEVLARLKTTQPELPVIMITAFGDVDTAVEAMKAGALDFLTKPFHNDVVVETIRRALKMRALSRKVRALEVRLDQHMPLAEAMGSSDEIQKVFDLVDHVAKTTFTVLLYGETGAGKELVARSIHKMSGRTGQAFVAVDCGSIPETLIESELFGYEKGAFTGADRDRTGQFELADQGTLFLDEIGNLPLAMQSKLLRVLQERRVQRLGSKQTRPVDIRVIAASNEPLDRLVEQDRFRRDLFFRLNEFVIQIPPLRERRDDIIYLCKRFIDMTNEELDKNVRGLSEPALSLVLSYDWPGNARELRNVIRRAVLLADDLIQPIHLSGLPLPAFNGADARSESGFDFNASFSLTDMVKVHAKQYERQVIAEALKQTDGNKSRAARLLKIDYKTLHYKVKNMEL